MRSSLLSLFAIVVTAAAACTDPTATGKGTAKFSTWGEEFIEQELPAGDGEGGFVDGWRVKYDKFLVVFHDIAVADAAGAVAAKLDRPRFVDNVKPGVKDLVAFPDLDARAYPKVTYAIRPAVADAQIVAGDPADLAMMVEKGYSLYVSGTATRPDPSDATKTLTKTFRWGFKTQTRYEDCHAEENGVSVQGVVVTANQTDDSELTTHGDHLFYDRLQSGDDAKKTLLRFAEKAAADDAPTGDGDGEVTLAELCRANIDPAVYNTSGLPGATIGDFVISLTRTVGHFRGEGECTVKRIDPVASGVVNPCDEYR